MYLEVAETLKLIAVAQRERLGLYADSEAMVTRT